jgi:cobalt/nickel transport system permease protein
MTLAFSLPPRTDSPLARLDPRWKLAALLLAAVATALLRTAPAALLALAGALLLAGLARLPLRWYLGRLAALALFLVLFAAPLPFFLPQGGSELALLVSTKAVALVTLLLVGLATAPLDATLKAAHALRVPGLLVQLVLLSYRYLFVLADELTRLRIALRVRGYRNRPNRHSYRTVGHVAGTLLVRGYERAERVGQAMRCRGFTGQFRSLTAFRTRPADVLLFLAVAGCAGALCCWDRLSN